MSDKYSEGTPRVITRMGKKYVFASETASSDDHRLVGRIAKNNAEMYREQGRKTVIVRKKKGNRIRIMVYVSSEFYPGSCRALHPSFGTGRLAR